MHTETEKMLIARQAAEWRLRLENADPAEQAEFWKWLSESPAHIREALAAEVTHLTLKGLLHDRKIDAEEYIRQAANVHNFDDYADEVNREEHIPSSDHSIPAIALHTQPTRSRWMLATAASVAVLLTAITLLAYVIQDRRISTSAGEWQTKELSDGSTVLATPNTQARVEFTPKRRIVRLTQGEAMFHVAKNPNRPFVVETELASVQAVGTAFAVRRDDGDQIRVTVKEGIVAVSRHSHSADETNSLTLLAGDAVSIRTTGEMQLEHVNAEAELAWEHGKIVLEDYNLSEAVDRFNHFNKKQIKVLDRSIADHGVHGVFSITDPETFATYVSRQEAVSIVHEDLGTLLLVPLPDKVEKRSLESGAR